MIGVVKYYSPGCGPCKVAGAALSKLRDDLGGQWPVHFNEIDVAANPEMAREAGVTTVPVVVIIKDGAEVQRFVGCKRYSEYRNAVEEALEA